MTGPDHFPYVLVDKRCGRVTDLITYQTPITGYTAVIEQEIRGKWVRCLLTDDGALSVFPDTLWDFGTGAIDTPDVVRASLAHDMFCHLTDLGLIPWKYRKIADNYYRELLLQYGCTEARAHTHWAVVRTNSKFRAYWKRVK